MKKVALLLFVLLGLSLGFLWATGGKAPTETNSPPIRSGATPEKSGLPTSSPVAGTPAKSAEESAGSEGPPPQRSAYFPGAKVISKLEAEGKKPGETRILKMIETNMSQRYVRIEETYRASASGPVLIEEAAMVANQVLVARPKSITEPAFLAILREAGATAIKKTGANFLATFPAEPGNPRSIEEFLARVREAAGVDVVTSPNYIRKLI